MKAFPYEESYDHQGMDLRDYFASKAMQGMVSSVSSQFNIDAKMVSKDAYIIADAMMEERKQKLTLDACPSVDEVTNVLTTLGLDKNDGVYRQIITLAWTRAFKKGN
jgi:hypothetical protein